ncbi:MAG TPA: N-6 DNA methylase [Candidatus Fermentibacter daniensis]|nr:N-6 DNA methylase [Candidatus Fermentibacter daniensis]HOR06515.1 N-6 DNA methylase [Candidatus Fermentibacter daniensis]HPK50744.1 N-6 DNA methylase [Candidatus Fermentibacter daniensis]
MLDSATRHRIDTARDILVGKVPDPKSQVEQITIALIYKFMDDMDAESEELGGSRSFFAGDFEKYGWARLMRPGLGGHEMLNLYAEAITRMPENPGIPPLFRSIFKNAYLPYRDPETLRLFLKVIDEFTYDHSERLGDAFEYLLSVLGSQGDAGQFRTPRHIIDFIVEVIDPKKNEKVLDPACGTAGFLISSWKHILKANTDANGNSTLTPDEKRNLAANFSGYDISPDMVRLSQVNMYLHGFADPHIYEYDTLTSLDKWNEHADVILANPPFMSPKGGIRPHNRFTVQSKRSEVLFVDYMAEHLTPNGRAGIIVPEGIIFQSGTAYKQLRKLLVEEYLVAVVSLPAGVFNPYSGVKTSILILDRLLARRTDSIAFFKVQNDGFSLGAQRREIDKNDLPQAAREITDYLSGLRAGETPESPSLGLIVKKEKIAANGDWNLSGERYRESGVQSVRWPLVRISDICEFRSGLWKGEKEPLRVVKILRNTNFTKNGFLDLSNIAEHPVEIRHLESRLLQYGDILLEKSGGGPTQPVGRVALFNLHEGEYSFSNFTARIRATDKRADPIFVWLCLNHIYRTGATEALQKQTSGIRNLDNPAYQAIKIPLPPLEVQREIVAEIEGYQKVIDGARMVVDNYRPHIPIDPEWPMVRLEKLCVSIQNGFPVKQQDDGRYLVTRIQTIADGTIDLSKTKRTNDPVPEDRLMEHGDILFSHINSIDHLGKTAIFRGAPVPVVHGINLIRFRPRTEFVDSHFLLWSMKQDHFIETAKSFAQRAVNQASIKVTDIREMEIPIPRLSIQQEIVAEIDTEQALVQANRDLIARFEKKIASVLERV